MKWSALTSFSRYDTLLNYIKIMPGIVMAGTAPTFYEKIIVHMSLLAPTLLTPFCLPPVPRPGRLHSSEGMQPLDNRHPIVSCYEAFAKVLATSFHFIYVGCMWSFSRIFVSMNMRLRTVVQDLMQQQLHVHSDPYLVCAWQASDVFREPHWN
jgi:hypothetical protein